MVTDYRTLDDLSDNEYDDYETNPDKYEDVTNNTNDTYIDMMYPDRDDDDDDLW